LGGERNPEGRKNPRYDQGERKKAGGGPLKRIHQGGLNGKKTSGLKGKTLGVEVERGML